MARVFLSYSSKDKAFVKALAGRLAKLGHIVWFDEWEIRVGDSIVTHVEGGIDRSDFVVVVLSKHSTSSRWVENEWQAKYWDEVNRRRVMVLPVLLDDCSIPALLRPKKYADFRSDHDVGLVDLVIGLTPRQDVSGIERYFSDFVDIVDNWFDFFTHSRQLDVVVMYAATWRNTYLKNIREMLSRPEGRLRIVLPAVQRTNNPVFQVYAKRLAISPDELHVRITRAIHDFGKLSAYGLVEVYTTMIYFNHACYLFDAGGILSLYSFRNRSPTPALVLREGALLNFLRDDFEWLVSEHNPTRHVIQAP